MDSKRKNTTILVGLGAVILIIAAVLIGQTMWLNSNNMYAKMADSVEDATNELKTMDISKSRDLDAKDFYGKYLKNTSFALEYKDRVIYDQGYYMVYKENGKVVFCLDPTTTAWTVKNKKDLKQINNHTFKYLSNDQKVNVLATMVATNEKYSETEDEKYLVAGQLNVWEIVGASIESNSGNLEGYRQSIEKLASSRTGGLEEKVAQEAASQDKDSQVINYYATRGQDLVSLEEGKKVDIHNVSINKEVNKQTATPGDQLEYRIRVKNLGNVKDTITVKDTLEDENLDYDLNSAIYIDGKMSAYTVNDLINGQIKVELDANQEAVLTFKVKVNSGITNGADSISNSAQACIATAPQEDNCEEDGVDIPLELVPNVEIQKEVEIAGKPGISEVTGGDVLVYTLYVTNTGNVTSDFNIYDRIEDENVEVNDNDLVIISGNNSQAQQTVGALRNPDVGINLQGVNPGEVYTISYEVHVKDLDQIPNGKEILNTATACIPLENGGDLCDTDDAEIPLIQHPEISIEKSAKIDGTTPIEVAPGDTIEYILSVTNEGNTDELVTISDVPQNIEYLEIDRSQKLNIDGGKPSAKYTVGDLLDGRVQVQLNAGESTTISYTVKLKESGDVLVDVLNIATACIGEDDCTDDSVEIPVIENPRHEVEKSMTVGGQVVEEVQPGDQLDYEIVVKNTGNTDLEIAVTDTPQNLNAIDIDRDQLLDISPAASKTYTVGDLLDGRVLVSVPRGGTVTIKYFVTVKEDIAQETLVGNAVVACIEGTKNCETDETEVPIEDLPKHEIHKTMTVDGKDVDEVSPGDRLDYKLVIRNTGNTDETISVQDVPNNTGALNIDRNQIIIINPAQNNTYTLGDLLDGNVDIFLEKGEEATITYHVQVKDDIGQEVVVGNAATACIPRGDQNEDCETDETEVPIEDTYLVEIDKELDEGTELPITPGQELNYKLVVRNMSNGARDIDVQDQLNDPSLEIDPNARVYINNATLVSPVGSASVGDLQNGIVINMEPGEATIEFTVHAVAGFEHGTTSIFNSASVCMPKPDESEECDNGEVEVPIEDKEEVEIEKSVKENEIKPGEELNYKIVARNTGTIKTDIIVRDALDNINLEIIPGEEVQVVETSGQNVNYRPNPALVSDIRQGITLVDTLPDQEFILTFKVKVKDGITGEDLTVSNVAFACIPQDGEDENCEKDDVEIPVVPTPSIDINKSVEISNKPGVGVAEGGDTLIYTLEAKNDGDISTDILVYDEMLDPNIVIDDTQVIKIDGVTDPQGRTVADLRNPDTGILLENVAPNESRKISFEVKVRDINDIPQGTEILNTSTACIPQGDENEDCKDADVEIPITEHPEITIDKEADFDGETVDRGQEIKYKLTVKNIGNTDESEVTISDTPQNIDLLDIDRDQVLIINGVNSNYTVGDLLDGNVTLSLAKGEEATIEYKVTVKDEVGQGTEIINVAQACISEANQNENCDIDGSEVPLTPEPRHEIGKSMTVDGKEVEQVKPGDRLDYKITVSNTGNTDETITITDAPTNFDAVLVNENQVLNITPDQNQEYTLRDLLDGNVQIRVPMGEEVTIEYFVTVKDDVGQEVEVGNAATACIPDINQDENCKESETETPIEPQPRHEIEKSMTVGGKEVTQVKPGDRLDYELIIKNTGNTDEVITIQDTPDNLEAIDIDRSQVIVISPEQENQYTLGDLLDGNVQIHVEKGQQVTINYYVQVKADVGQEVEVGNAATACIPRDDATDDCEKDTTEVPIEDTYLVEIEKQLDESVLTPVVPGESLKYTLVIRNNSNGARDIVVQDKLDDPSFEVIKEAVLDIQNATLVDPAGSSATVSDLQNGITINMEPGEATISFLVSVVDGFGEGVTNITNTATACMPKEDETEECDKDSVDVPVDDTASFTSEKNVSSYPGDTETSPGDTLTYKIVVTNTGNVVGSYQVQDDLADINLDVDKTNAITITDSKGNQVSSTPTNPTVGDLQNGMTINDIMPGQIVTLSFDVKVKESIDNTNEEITNTAKVCNPKTPDDCETPGTEIPLITAPGSTIEKSVETEGGEQSAEWDDVLTYSLRVTNTGDRVDTLIVKDPLTDPNFIVDDSQIIMIDGVADANKQTLGDLRNIDKGVVLEEMQPQETRVISFTVKVKSFDEIPQAEVIANTSTVCPASGSTEDCDDSGIEIPLKETPDFNIDKIMTVGGSEVVEVSPGDMLDYTITVNNTGNVDGDFTVTDTPQNTVAIDIDRDQVLVIDPAQGANYTVGDLLDGNVVISIPKGETATIKYHVTVKDDIGQETMIGNAASTCLPKEGETPDCKNTETEVPIEENPEFNLVKDMIVGGQTPESVQSGDRLDYNITINNTGNTDGIYTVIDTPQNTSVLNIDRSQVLVINPNQENNYTLGDLLDGNVQVMVPKGEQVEIKYYLTVKDDIGQETLIGNSATACPPTDPNECETGETEVPIEENPEFNLVKNMTVDGSSVETVAPGDRLDYELTITNTGNVDGTYTVQDSPQSINALDYDRNQILIINPTQGSVYTLGDLLDGNVQVVVPKGEQVTIKYYMVVSNNIGKELIVGNSATACLPGDDEDENCSKDQTEVPIEEIKDLTIAKNISDSNNDGYAESDEELTYTIKVTNTGNTVKDIIVMDPLEDENLNVQGNEVVAIDSGSAQPSKPMTEDLRTSGITLIGMNPGETRLISFTVKADKNFTGAPSIDNKATATLDEINKDSSASIPIQESIDFEVTKGVKDQGNNNIAEAGEMLTYSVTVTNLSDITTDISVQDPISDPNLSVQGTEIVSVDNGVTTPNNPLTSDLRSGIILRDMKPGEVRVISFEVSVKTELSEASDIENTVTAAIDDLEKDASADIPLDLNYDFSIIKDVKDASDNGTAEPGEELTYTIKVINEGNTLNDILVSDPLNDPSLDVVGNEAVGVDNGAMEPSSPTTSDLRSGIILKNMKPGEIRTITFVVKVVDGPEVGTTLIKNTATATMNDESEEASADIPVNIVVDFTIDKNVSDKSSDDVAQSGEDLTYTIKVTNIGNITKDIVVRDLLNDPNLNVAGTEVVTVDSGATQPTNPTTSALRDGLTLLDMAPSESREIKFTVSVKGSLTPADEITNTAHGTMDGKDKDASAQIPLEGTSDFTIDKDVKDASDNNVAETNEELTYTITVTNTGTLESDIVVRDPLSDINLDVAGTEAVVISAGTTNPANPTTSTLKTGITLNSMAAGETRTLTFKVHAKNIDATQTEIKNTVTGTMAGTDKSASVSIPLGHKMNIIDYKIQATNLDMWVKYGNLQLKNAASKAYSSGVMSIYDDADSAYKTPLVSVNIDDLSAPGTVKLSNNNKILGDTIYRIAVKSEGEVLEGTEFRVQTPKLDPGNDGKTSTAADNYAFIGDGTNSKTDVDDLFPSDIVNPSTENGVFGVYELESILYEDANTSEADWSENDLTLAKYDHIIRPNNSNYKVTNSIDGSASKANTVADNKGGFKTDGYRPIGHITTTTTGLDGVAFTGKLIGTGSAYVKNLYINNSSIDRMGIISWAKRAEVNNIGLVDPEYVGGANIGGYVGFAQSVNMTNVYTGQSTDRDGIGSGSFDIDGRLRVGGLIGMADSVNINSDSRFSTEVPGMNIAGGDSSNLPDANSYKTFSTVDVRARYGIAGGLVGQLGSPSNDNTNTLTNVYSKSNVGSYKEAGAGGRIAGGLAGNGHEFTIQNVYYKNSNPVSVYAEKEDASGVIAFPESPDNGNEQLQFMGSIKNAYNAGNIKASTGSAGIMAVGQSTRIENVYNTGDITTTSAETSLQTYAGGIIGNTYDVANSAYEIKNSYNVGTIASTSTTKGTSALAGIIGEGSNLENNNTTYTPQRTFNSVNLGDVKAQVTGYERVGSVSGNCPDQNKCSNSLQNTYGSTGVKITNASNHNAGKPGYTDVTPATMKSSNWWKATAFKNSTNDWQYENADNGNLPYLYERGTSTLLPGQLTKAIRMVDLSSAEDVEQQPVDVLDETNEKKKQVYLKDAEKDDNDDMEEIFDDQETDSSLIGENNDLDVESEFDLLNNFENYGELLDV